MEKLLDGTGNSLKGRKAASASTAVPSRKRRASDKVSDQMALDMFHSILKLLEDRFGPIYLLRDTPAQAIIILLPSTLIVNPETGLLEVKHGTN